MNPDNLGPLDQVFLNDWLVLYMGKRDITQAALARALGIDSSCPGRWVIGNRPVPQNRLLDLAAALGVDVGQMLDSAHIVERGYTNDRPEHLTTATAKPISRPSPVVVLPAAPAGPLSPSVYPLRWCERTHLPNGVAPVRHSGERHHHGPAQSWQALVTTRIEDLM